MTHTPGPWRLPYTREVVGDYYHIIEAGDPYAADEPGISGFHLSGFMSAEDARLIAAAPDLLAAAKIVAADESWGSHAYRVLWDAIAKAEGLE